MTDVFISEDKQVVKVVHEDGSETAVKTVKSVDGRIGPDGEVHYTSEDRGKYSLFLSGSAGCIMRCEFCHLTIKKAKYVPLEEDGILRNAQDAVLEAVRRDESIVDRYAKICWMGMGEDGFRNPERTYRLTNRLAEWLLDSGLTPGIDGVDLSTVLPRTHENWGDVFSRLDDALDGYPSNPGTKGRDAGRSRFRLFFSLHSGVQETRNRLIPGATPIFQALPQVAAFRESGKHSVIIHHLLFEDINDSDAEVDAVVDALRDYDLMGSEIRLLRYNSCGTSDLVESHRFSEAAAKLAAVTPVKVQTSLGTEVKAACGQFIVRDYDSADEIKVFAQATADIMKSRGYHG